MPKQKTHSGTKDRVRVTKSGKIMLRKSNRNHNMMKKSAARKRKLSTATIMTGAVKKNLKKGLGI